MVDPVYPDGFQRSPEEDLSVPVEQMPPWANPGYMDKLASPDYGASKILPYSRSLHCPKCLVRWRQREGGDHCWICGEPSTHAYWISQDDTTALPAADEETTNA